jgi:hypothetical protein
LNNGQILHLRLQSKDKLYYLSYSTSLALPHLGPSSLILILSTLTLFSIPGTIPGLTPLLRNRLWQELLKALYQVWFAIEELPHLAMHIRDFIQVQLFRILPKKGQEAPEDFGAVGQEAVLWGLLAKALFKLKE